MGEAIQLKLFGTFQLQVGGGEVGFKRRKSDALMAYLFLHSGAQPREKIASLLWADSSNEDARRSLRVTLTDVRKMLGEDALLGGRDTLEINPNLIAEVDVLTFTNLLQDRASASDADLLAAIDLYRGDLLEGIYDEWVFPLREQYRALLLEAFFTLIERARAAGDYPRAIQYAEDLLTRDPLNEKALQHLLFCLAASGEKEQAIRRFRALQEKDEIEFSAETLTLFEQIRRQENASPTARLSNLPRPLTSFIGREHELNEIETLLTKDRLVTLLGAGGSGKTRLAIQTADEIAYQFTGGVWWVDLSPLVVEGLVAQSIGKALGVQEKAGEDMLSLTAKHIGEQSLLVVLDNCEHLISACARSVEYMLAQCPQVVVLATSRIPLGVAGEAGWQVPTFPLPEADLDSTSLRKNEAARLFIERGRNANSSFQLTEENAAHVANICRKLDGIPLGIELAAALLRTMPVSEVSRRLNQRFEILHITDENRPPRQQTLRALIDWSYNLLTSTEQTFFRRLGVFAGGWSFDAAVVVGGGYDEDLMQRHISGGSSAYALPINPADIVLGLLDSLRQRSLIHVSYQNEFSHYSMLETLREYALERLEEAGELSAARDRHLKQTLAFVSEANSHIMGQADQLEWTERLDHEVDNIRAGLAWAVEGGDIQQGLALGAAAFRFWAVRAFYGEARDWLETLTNHPQAQGATRERGYALVNRAFSLRNTRRIKEALPLLDEALGIFKALNDSEGLAFARYCLGEMSFNNGRLDDATHALHEAVSYYHANGSSAYGLANSLIILGRVALAKKDFDTAYEYIGQAAAIAETQSDHSTMAWCKLMMGDIAYGQNHLPLARQNYEDSLAQYRPMKRLANIAYLLEALASVAYWLGELDAARNLADESIHFYALRNEGTAFSRATRAAIAQSDGDMQTAEDWLLHAVTPLTAVEDIYRSVYLVKLADFAAAKGDAPAALTLYLTALRLADDPNAVLFPPDRHHAQTGVESARTSMKEAEFTSAKKRGEGISFGDAVRLVFPSVQD